MPTIREYVATVLTPEELNPTYTPTLPTPFVLSTASSIISQYPAITSAYLFGSYAKNTARPQSDIDIALFTSAKGSELLSAIGGVVVGLEKAFEGKEVDVSVCPPEDFVERVEKYWLQIELETAAPEKYSGGDPQIASATSV